MHLICLGRALQKQTLLTDLSSFGWHSECRPELRQLQLSKHTGLQRQANRAQVSLQTWRKAKFQSVHFMHDVPCHCTGICAKGRMVLSCCTSFMSVVSIAACCVDLHAQYSLTPCGLLLSGDLVKLSLQESLPQTVPQHGASTKCFYCASKMR